MMSFFLTLLTTAWAATYSTSFTLEELGERADRVVLGQVVDTRSERGAHPVETVATIEVSETLAGDASKQVEVRVPGGELDGVHMAVPGAPVLQDGQQVVLFLDGTRLVGFAHGAYVVQGEELAPAETWTTRGVVAYEPIISLEELRWILR